MLDAILFAFARKNLRMRIIYRMPVLKTVELFAVPIVFSMTMLGGLPQLQTKI